MASDSVLADLLAVLIDGIARQVDLVVPEYAGSALVELYLVEQPGNSQQVSVAGDLLDVLHHIVENGLPVIKDNVQVEVRPWLNGSDSRYHGLHLHHTSGGNFSSFWVSHISWSRP